MKLQAQTNTAPPPGLNIEASEDPSITSGLAQEAVEDEDISLLGVASLAIDPAEDNISLLGDETSLVGSDVHPTEEVSLGSSTAADHTSASRVKQATSLINQ